jgi:hypothetical protein
MIRALSVIIVRTMPQFYQLACLINAGKFLSTEFGDSNTVPVAVAAAAAAASDKKSSNTTSSSSVAESLLATQRKRAQQTMEAGQYGSQIQVLLVGIGSCYSALVRKALLPRDDEHALALAGAEKDGVHALPQTASDNVYQCCRCLQEVCKIPMPQSCIVEFKELVDDVVVHWLHKLFRNTFIRVSRLATKEHWDVDVSQVKNRGVTTLPLQFHRIMMNVVTRLQCIPRIERWMMGAITAPLLECFRLFADCLHRLAFFTLPSDAKRSSHHHNDSENDVDDDDDDDSDDYDEGRDSAAALKSSLPTSGAVNLHQRRLLAVLCNSMFCIDHVFPAIWARYKTRIEPAVRSQLQRGFNDVLTVTETLEQRLREEYIRIKTLALNQLIARKLLSSSSSSSSSLPGASADEAKKGDDEKEGGGGGGGGVRPCVTELLLRLVFIHNELYSISQSQVTEVLEAIVEQIASSCLAGLVRLGAEQRMPQALAFQLWLELTVIETTLKRYLSTAARATFRQSFGRLKALLGPELVAKHRARRDKLARRALNASKVTYACFLEAA